MPEVHDDAAFVLPISLRRRRAVGDDERRGRRARTASEVPPRQGADPDGNGTPSFFSRTGKVEGGEVKLETNLYIENEFE